MNAELHEILKQWLLKAANDLKNAHIVIQHSDPPTDTIIYHCQQAIEKYLKAYLTYRNIEFPRTHDLERLLQKCIDSETPFQTLSEWILQVNSYGTGLRYPDNFYMPSEEEAQSMLQITEKIIQWVSNVFPEGLVTKKHHDTLCEAQQPSEEGRDEIE